MASAVVHRIRVFPLVIPLRYRISHAAAQQGVAAPVIVAVELTDGTVGYGEAVAQGYVTTESADSVVGAVQGVFAPFLVPFHPASFPETLEAVEALPWKDASGCLIPAARAAVELALLDAAMRTFGRCVEDMVQWMELPSFGARHTSVGVRFGGVLAFETTRTTLRQLRWMYRYGLRAFKLKVGFDGDRERLQRVASFLNRAIRKGRASLRIDANGRWSLRDATVWLADAARFPIVAVEQPLRRGDEESLVTLYTRIAFPIVHDESLITLDDARRLLELGVAGGFNIRISKCGGLLPSLRLAALAQRENVPIQLGGEIGETSLLAAVGLRFLEVCPGVTCAEGCLGTFLLREDIVAKSVRLRYGGRTPRVRGSGWGVQVDLARLGRLCENEPIVLNL